MTVVRTVLGDIPPEQLGFTLAHEHFYSSPPEEFAEADLCLGSTEEATAELRDFASVGGGAVVEMTTPDYRRDVRKLKRISEASGVHVVASTGFNKAKFADRYSAGLTEDELVDWMVEEVTQGIDEPPSFIEAASDRTGIRAGLIKGSSSLHGPTPAEEKVLRAVARAHHLTGAPVSTHTEKGTWTLEQAQFLLERNVRPDKLLIGHLDFQPDLIYLAELASLEVYLGFDQFSKRKYLEDWVRVELIVGLLERGFDNLLLSGDLARKSYWHVHGGSGFRHLPQTVSGMLRAAGLAEVQLEGLFIRNPAKWLSFQPSDPRRLSRRL